MNIDALITAALVTCLMVAVTIAGLLLAVGTYLLFGTYYMALGLFIIFAIVFIFTYWNETK